MKTTFDHDLKGVRAIKIQYFPETDTLSIQLNDQPSTESAEIAPDVVLDFDAAGGVVGLEIDLASSKVNLSNLDLFASHAM